MGISILSVIALRFLHTLVLAAAVLPQPALARRSHKDPDLPRLRPVLHGVLFRSGTPSDAGLQRLCREGYKRVYSLYGARTTARGVPNQAMVRTGADERRCLRPDGTEHTLLWLAMPASRGSNLPRLLRDVLETVREPSRGPILIHCWNGLHYAGMVAAMVLRQLCGASADAAEAYWWSTTRHGEHYPHVVHHIRAFRPLPGFALTDAERQRLCPELPAVRPQARLGR